MDIIECIYVGVFVLVIAAGCILPIIWKKYAIDNDLIR